jgi:hypothetical protein
VTGVDSHLLDIGISLRLILLVLFMKDNDVGVRATRAYRMIAVRFILGCGHRFLCWRSGNCHLQGRPFLAGNGFRMEPDSAVLLSDVSILRSIIDDCYARNGRRLRYFVQS